MRFVVCLIFIFAALELSAQEILSTIDLPSSNIDDIQVFEMGDSLFVTFIGKISTGPNRIKQGQWIHPGKQKESININALNGKLMLGITQDSSWLFYYSLESRQTSMVISVSQQKKDAIYVALPEIVYEEFDELLSTRIKENALELISYKKKTNALIRTTISGIQYTQTAYVMPLDISEDVKSFSGVLSDNRLPSIAQGAEKMKIWLTNDSLNFTIDRPYRNKESKTILCLMSLTNGTPTLKEIPGPPGMRFTSVYHNGLLYRLLVDPKYFKIEAHNSKTLKELPSFVIDKNSNANAVVYEQDLNSRKTQYSTLRTLIQYGAFNSTDASLLAETTADGSVQLTIGTFYNSNGRGSFVGFPNPFVMAGGFLITHAIARISEPAGLYRYCYLNTNADGVFRELKTQQEPTQNIRQKIDEYEAQRNTSVKNAIDKLYLYLLFKTQIPVKDGVLGIYQEKRKGDNKLILVKLHD